MTLVEKEEALVRELNRIPDQQARLSWLVGQASGNAPLQPELKTDRHRVAGCLSGLWIVPEFRHRRCWFRCDSDSRIVRAVASLLCNLASDCSPDELTRHTPTALERAGLARLLTANRRDSLSRVWATIQRFAEDRLSDPPPADSSLPSDRSPSSDHAPFRCP